MLVFTGDELVSQVLNVAASSTLYTPEKTCTISKNLQRAPTAQLISARLLSRAIVLTIFVRL